MRARGKVVPIMVSFRKSLGTIRKLVPTHHLLCLLWVRPYPKANLGMVWVRFRLFISHQQHPTAITAHPRKTKNPRIYGVSLEMFGGQGRDRTGDTRIFSPLLYQLSYLATCASVKVLNGRGAGIRTLDPVIKSHLLYQLSYAPISP